MTNTPETRIYLIPLTYYQLLKYLKADNILEEELGLLNTSRTISPDVKDMVETFTLPAMRRLNGVHYLFYTFWIVIEKNSNSIVAELGFKGPPNVNGAVEIGYGTMPGQRCRGYMTEAVSAILDWAAQQPDVHEVLAEVDENNVASRRIVEKNGFVQFDKKGCMLWWKKILVK